jgi:hypothetical protein
MRLMFQERSTLLRVESRRLLSRCQRGLSWTTGSSSSPSAGARSRSSCRAPISARCISSPQESSNSSLKGRRTGATNLEHALGGRPAKWRGNSGGLCSGAVHLRKGRRAYTTQEEAPALLVARAPLLHAHGAPEVRRAGELGRASTKRAARIEVPRQQFRTRLYPGV